jgi:hypothetical protein
MAQVQQTLEQEKFTREQLDIFRDLLENTNDAFTGVQLPLVLIDREKTIMHLRKAKEDIDKLQEIL